MTNWPNLVPIILVEQVIARTGECERYRDEVDSFSECRKF
jgi:hypothetical protein